MNQFKNGTLFVVIATFVTVVLLLLTGRDEVKQPDEPVITKAEEAPEKIAIVEKESPTETNSSVEKTSSVDKDTLTKKEVAPVIEEKPQEKIAETSKEQPPLGFFSYEDKAFDDKTVAVAETAKSKELVENLSQPIWMNQTLGEFKSLKDNEMVINVVPTNIGGLQGDKPSEVVTSKSGRFVANSMPSDYNYQEMPMYNGGYYIAPMPAYLMSSVLPKSSKSKK